MATLEHKNIPDTELHPPARVAASDPGAIGAGRGWIDTSGSPYLLKIRNGTNTGWDTIGATGGGVISVADAAARFALTGLGRLATVYQEDNGFYYQVVDPDQLDDPAGWSALPKVYSANFYIDGTPEVVVTREDNQTGVGITLNYQTTGEVRINSNTPLFNAYTQVWAQLNRNRSANVAVLTIAVHDNQQCRLYGFEDGVAANEIFGDGTNSTTALKIEVYPEPD